MSTTSTMEVSELLRRTLDFCRACLDRGDSLGAYNALTRGLALAPTDPEILSQRGRILLVRRDFKAAHADFSVAVQSGPDCAMAHSGLALYHLEQNSPEAAKKCAQQALQLNPADEDALQVLEDTKSMNPSPSLVPVPTPSNSDSDRPTESPVMPKDDLRNLARVVGDDWKKQQYYDDAEAWMERQWKERVWPFIKDADFSCVLDLAAGHGRNSEKLKAYARKIYVVDINRENVDFCRARFAGDDRFVIFQNDGCSLETIPSGSISLVYCFDAMVHFDSDIVRAYLGEFRRVLRPGGLGFCHHSNYSANPGGDVHQNRGWRNYMSQSLFTHYCAKEGLKVLKSQVIDWDLPESDCLTLFTKAAK